MTSTISVTKHTTEDLLLDLRRGNAQMRWDEVVTKSGRPRQPWPHGLITYCFATPAISAKYKDTLIASWNLWKTQIGEPSKENQHQLNIKEHGWWDKEWPYCYNEQKNPGDELVWNSIVPAQTVVINELPKYVQGLGASAIVGYIPDEWPVHSPREGRHMILFNPGAKDKYPDENTWIAAIAHELGHVAGLWHEHQRPDRDHYVRLNCRALPGYDAAKVKVDQWGEDKMEDVCNDGTLAGTYGFSIIDQYDKINHLDRAGYVDDQYWYLVQSYKDREYDTRSLMHWGSDAHYWRDDDEKLRVQLALWKNGGPDYTPPEQPTKDDLKYSKWTVAPTRKDAEGIRKIYPWKG